MRIYLFINETKNGTVKQFDNVDAYFRKIIKPIINYL